MSRARGEAAIPYEGHLLLAVSRRRLRAQQAVQLAEIARLVDAPLPAKGSTAGGDPARLRGIPVCGHGGAIRGTRPGDGLDRLDRLRASLIVLAADLDGTSPGTQPEQALLDRGEYDSP